MASNRNVLVYGGSGQLGREVVNTFRTRGWTTFAADYRANETATHSITLTGDPPADARAVLAAAAAQRASFEAVICVAGGWCPGNIASDDVFTQLEKMHRMNVQSAVAASHIASKTLKEGGLLVLTGAASALAPCGGQIAYGIAKAGTHLLITSLAADSGGLPKGASVVGLLPVMLDTQTNRQDMPGANTDSWTPLPVVANALGDWAEGKARPKNGHLLKFVTEKHNTRIEPVHA